jgi:hypothetical protein
VTHSFSWQFKSGVTDTHWARFCEIVAVALDCPAVPLYASETGGLRRVDQVVDLARLSVASKPQSQIVLFNPEGDVAFTFTRGVSAGASCEEPVASLAYAALLVAKGAVPGFELTAVIEKGYADLGMVLARNALAKKLIPANGHEGPAISHPLLNAYFKRLPGSDDVPLMVERSRSYAPLRRKVQALLESVEGASPEGKFEEVTLRTAKAIYWRLEHGVDSEFNAKYSVESLEGNFRQSTFIAPDSTDSAPRGVF